MELTRRAIREALADAWEAGYSEGLDTQASYMVPGTGQMVEDDRENPYIDGPLYTNYNN